jgi:hypothetical protein
MNFFIESILAPMRSVGEELLAFFPKMLAALLVLIAGFIVAWMMRKLSLLLFRWLKIDVRLSDFWIFRLWSRGHSQIRPSRAFSGFIYYIFLFIFVLIVVRVVGGKTGEAIIDSMFEIIPGILTFILVIFLGLLLAMFLSFMGQILFFSSNVKYPSFWGKIVGWGVFGIAVIYSLENLGVAGKLLSFVFILLLSILGMALALAFGLGCRDLAKEFMIEMLKKSRTSEAEDE